MKKIFLIVATILPATTCVFSQSVIKEKANPVIQKNLSTKVSAIKNNSNSSNQNNGAAGATLSDEYFSLNNETDKPANVHWSCTLFDQNGRQVASFQDNNQNEYSAGSTTPAFKMQTINAATLGDFFRGGRLHITIEPKGKVNWKISVLTLTLDFLNPKFTQNLSWKEIDLSDGKKEADILFNDAPQYDVMKNKSI